jgi:hypothetical protein
MLGHGHQLNMSKALGHHIFSQLVGELTITQPGPPRHQMHLVGAHRLENRILPGATRHPFVVLPGVIAGGDLRCGLRWHLGGECQRISAIADRPIDAVHPELVQAADRKARPKQLPHPGRAEHPHRRFVTVPVIELADQAHALGIRCPHGKRHPLDLAVGGGEGARVRAEDLPESFVAALGEQVQVKFAQRRQEPVGVGHGVHVRRITRSRVADLQAIVDQVGERQHHGEQFRLDVLEDEALVADEGRHLDRVGAKCTQHGVIAVFVCAEYRVRVVMLAGQQAPQVGGIGPQVSACGLVGSRHLALIPAQKVQSLFVWY